MEGINAARISEVKAPEVKNRENIKHTVIKDMEPDSFEPTSKKKLNVAEVAIAAGTAAGVYKPAKTGLAKAAEWAEKEYKNFVKEFAESKVKTGVKFGGAAAATLGAFYIALRDKDGNGQLDLIDGLKRILNP